MNNNNTPKIPNSGGIIITNTSDDTIAGIWLCGIRSAT